MRRLLAIAVTTTCVGTGSAHAQVAADRRTSDLVAQARTALGGAAALAKVTALACVGTYTRDVQDRQLSGDLTIDLQLPDRMLRTETMSPMGNATVTVEQGFNGDTLLQHSATSGGPGMMFRMGGADTPEARAERIKGLKADAARLTLALLLAAPGMPLQASYAGEADAPDGKADVLDLKGTGSFAARLFLDRTSHRPLMLTYRGLAPRIVVATARRGDTQRSPEPGALPAPEPVDIAMYFDDYRSVDGIWFPHHVSRSVADQPSEEWTFTAIVVNPSFKPDTFQPK